MLAAGLALAAGALAARPALVLGVDGKSLVHSVESKTASGGGDDPTCQPTGSRVWHCRVLVSSDGDPTEYRVTVNGRGCWRARRVKRGFLGGPRRTSGCIGLTNYVRRSPATEPQLTCSTGSPDGPSGRIDTVP